MELHKLIALLESRSWPGTEPDNAEAESESVVRMWGIPLQGSGDESQGSMLVWKGLEACKEQVQMPEQQPAAGAGVPDGVCTTAESEVSQLEPYHAGAPERVEPKEAASLSQQEPARGARVASEPQWEPQKGFGNQLQQGGSPTVVCKPQKDSSRQSQNGGGSP